jgi:outer membrane protein assembly factor BamB
MLASQWGVYLCSAEDARFVALSATDGTEQYQTTSEGNRAEHKVLAGGVLFAKNLADHGIVNAATAQPITTGYNGFNWAAGCGPLSTSRDWMFGQAGGVANRLNPSFQSYPYSSTKVDCSVPTIISNGMALFPSSGCGCPDLHRGFIGAVPAGTFQFDRQAVESERLQTGPALGAITSTLTPGAADWWTHRANVSRTGMVPVALPTTGLQQMWKYTPAVRYDTTTLDVGRDFRAEQEATPAVSIGNRVFFAGSDGYVRCIEDGATVWSFATGSRVYATPTVTGGCVFVGSADGYAYCLDAADGDLVWQNNTCGPIYDATARRGFTPSGYMTIVGSKLWVRAHKGRDGIFDLNTGVMDSLPAVLAGRNGGPTVRGRDIGVIDNTHIIHGGRLLYCESGERGAFARALWYNFLRLNAQGTPTYPELTISDWASTIAPAWDSQNMYYALSGEMYLDGWTTSRLTQQVDSFQTAWDVATRPSDWPNWKEVTVQPTWVPGWQGNAPTTPMSIWRQTPPTDSVIEMRAMALSSNALVVLQARHHKWEYSNWKWCHACDSPHR